MSNNDTPRQPQPEWPVAASSDLRVEHSTEFCAATLPKVSTDDESLPTVNPQVTGYGTSLDTLTDEELGRIFHDPVVGPKLRRLRKLFPPFGTKKQWWYSRPYLSSSFFLALCVHAVSSGLVNAIAALSFSLILVYSSTLTPRIVHREIDGDRVPEIVYKSWFFNRALPGHIRKFFVAIWRRGGSLVAGAKQWLVRVLAAW